MDLVQDDIHLIKIFEEASQIMMPAQLRTFFAHFIISENIDASKIWNLFKFYFIEGFENNFENRALLHISSILNAENISCADCGLPEPLRVFENEFDNAKIEHYKKLANDLYCNLNIDQKLIFHNAIEGENRLMFVDGPGGSGKTYLYKAIVYHYLSVGKKVLPMAWTGIASILLPKGMTSHRTFLLPIDLEKYETLFIEKQQDKKRLREADIIIWDECSMIPKKALEMINITLQDLCCNSLPFGGKIVIIGGDFRQILPVLRFGHRESIVEQSIKKSYLWPLFKTFKLSINVRSTDSNFSKFLLEIGNGTVSKFVVPEKWKTDDVCHKIFSDINSTNCTNNVILSTHNDTVRKLNKTVLNFIEKDEKIYLSIDYATYKGSDKADDNIYFQFPFEYLNNINTGLPPHELQLKINCIVMLIRNLSISDGLCNGTRLKILKLYEYNIMAEIITGDKSGDIVFLPKVTMSTGESNNLPFILHRKQFPVVLAFAITINKSQGQSFDMLGIYIDRPLFSHGQLYVALSRAKNPNQLFIQNCSNDLACIENVVWKEIFE